MITAAAVGCKRSLASLSRFGLGSVADLETQQLRLVDLDHEVRMLLES